MILGVMSDAHCYLTEMRQAAAKMLVEFGVEILIHLGDDSTDADELSGITSELISVPGVFEERYCDPNVPNRIIRKFDGIPFLITHTPISDQHDLPGDIDPTEAAQDGDVKVVLYGHTHIPSISEKHWAIYINPGQLKPDDMRGHKPSFAIIKTFPSKIKIKIIELNGAKLEDKTFFIR